MKISKQKPYLAEREALETILSLLKQQDYKVVGPTIRDNAIIFDDLEELNDLPAGMTDEHEPGSYRLIKRKDKALFGYNVGPSSCKQYLFPPALTLLQTQKVEGKVTVVTSKDTVDKIALFGIKPCELAAILVQDKIFQGGEYVDSYYKAQRDKLFIVTANCTEIASSCFCASLNTGPEAQTGYDLAITELIDKHSHKFLIQAGTTAGVNLLKQIDQLSEAEEALIATAKEKLSKAGSSMKRSIDTTNLKALLLDNLNHAQWDTVAARCLACGNCTMVCPTCFCSNVHDLTSLTGAENQRMRVWDSCFSRDYSYIHGGAVRASTKSRYRQWMTHKLASWQDQFQTIGCVGCGRCIVWCPVGIDITAETRSIQDSVAAGTGA